MKETGGITEWSFALGLIFIVLKLCGIIRWSWLWVLAPFWIPAVTTVIIVIIIWWLSRKE